MQDIQKQAVKEVVKMLTIATAAATTMGLILTYVPLSTLGPIAAVGLLSFCIYNLYRIKLSELEYKQKLNDMVDKTSKS